MLREWEKNFCCFFLLPPPHQRFYESDPIYIKILEFKFSYNEKWMKKIFENLWKFESGKNDFFFLLLHTHTLIAQFSQSLFLYIYFPIYFHDRALGPSILFLFDSFKMKNQNSVIIIILFFNLTRNSLLMIFWNKKKTLNCAIL